MLSLAKGRHNWKVGLAILLLTLTIARWSTSDSNTDFAPKARSSKVPNRADEDLKPRVFPQLHLSKRDNDTVSAARKIVVSAIKEMRVSNKALVENPSRNIYTLKPGTPSKRRRGDPSPMVVNSTVAAAAALVAEGLSLRFLFIPDCLRSIEI
jgi:hypothetical protein